MVMPRHAVFALALFIALVLSVALTVLAASGHFPPEHRAASLRSGLGRIILFGACVISALALVVGAAVAWPVLPWPAAVIGAGAAMLAAPLLLRPLPPLCQWTRRAFGVRQRVSLAHCRPRLTAIGLRLVGTMPDDSCAVQFARDHRRLHPVPAQEDLSGHRRSSKALDERIRAKWAKDLPKGF